MGFYSDEELVRLYVDTKRNIYFEQIYNRHFNAVYRQCLSLSKDPTEAKDLVHDIFLKLTTKLSGFRAQAKFSTWLHVITHNYCTDHLRIQLARQKIYKDVNWEQLDIEYDEGEAKLLEQRSFQIEWSLKKLALDEQAILTMRYKDSLRIAEIAFLKGMTESAVKMRLMRTKGKFRKYYQESEFSCGFIE